MVIIFINLLLLFLDVEGALAIYNIEVQPQHETVATSELSKIHCLKLVVCRKRSK